MSAEPKRWISVTAPVAPLARVSRALVAEDLEERGVRREQCLAAAVVVPRATLADLYEHYSRIWHW